MNKLPAGYHQPKHERPLIEQDIDAYRMPAKLPEPTVCPECKAVFHQGRWQWLETPASAHHETCPACKRANDDMPAGYVTLEVKHAYQGELELHYNSGENQLRAYWKR